MLSGADNSSQRRGGIRSLERGLLVAIMLLQLVLLWTMWRGVRFRHSLNSWGQLESSADSREIMIDQVLAHENPSGEGLGLPVFDALFRGASRHARLFEPDRAWNRLTTLPGMDMRDVGQAYHLVFSLPNPDPGQLQVEVHGNVLRVWAVCDRGPLNMGRQIYQRHILLPAEAARDHGAVFDWTNGMLRVIVPKREPDPVRPMTVVY